MVIIFGVVAHAHDLMVPEAIGKSWSLWGLYNFTFPSDWSVAPIRS